MGLETKVKKFGVKRVLSYMDKNPEENIPKVIDWVLKHDKGDGVSSQTMAIQNAINDKNNKINDKDNNWHKFALSLWSDIDDKVRRKIFENIVVNASMFGSPKQRAVSAKEGCSVPWTILMDPTSACNLRCIGCWAANYDKSCNLSLEELDNIIRQGNKIGIYFYIYSGGEPMVRKKDLIKLCEMHPDCHFLAFTNGTLIDEEFADEMLRVKNFIPAISIEGFEEATDARRGKGTYKKVMNAMSILKRKKLPFGISCCYTRDNTEVIGSDEFIDSVIDMGAKFAWFFTYIPVGVEAVPELMVTADQRKFMYDKIRGWRDTKSIFTMDFWNDGEYVNGCIAGGRSYCHINANGDIEPCAFIHYSDSNIREKTLLEAFKSPLFMQYRKNQPFNQNQLRPCPLLDNNGKLAEMVDAANAKSTDMAHPEDVHDLCAKCKEAAENWKPVSEELWGDKVYCGHMKR